MANIGKPPCGEATILVGPYSEQAPKSGRRTIAATILGPVFVPFGTHFPIVTIRSGVHTFWITGSHLGAVVMARSFSVFCLSPTFFPVSPRSALQTFRTMPVIRRVRNAEGDDRSERNGHVGQDFMPLSERMVLPRWSC